MRYKEYLYQNYSDKLIKDVVKTAYKNKDIDSNRLARGIGYTGISALGNVILNHHLPSDKLGAVAGIAGGMGLGLSALTSLMTKSNTKTAIKNAIRSGLISEKDLNKYIKKGKLTPNLAITINKVNNKSI